VEKRTYKPDPFTVKDGRYVGSDGFVVPKDFAEFHERFPEYVRNWVSRHADRSTPKEDMEDWTQDLLIHLQSLPAISKHREAGNEDIVQTFDPHKHYGANEARFRNYINLCLANKFNTMRLARLKNPLCRPGNPSLTTDWEETDRNQVDDEFCHRHSEHLRKRCQQQNRLWDARQSLAEFSEFVKREDSSVLPAMEAIAAVGTWDAVAEFLGITRADFRRMRSRLRQLGRSFLRNEPVPRKPRPYRRGVAIRLSSRPA
jgi:hypothetical protein